MTDRYTKVLLGIIAIASTLILTACSNPDTSGGVTLSKGADDANESPHGSCDGPGKNTHDYDTGCGWIQMHDHRFYVHEDNRFPFGSCLGPDDWEHHSRHGKTGCGWIQDNDGSDFYVGYGGPRYCLSARCGDLTGANLSGMDLREFHLSWSSILKHANLSHANLSGMDLSGGIDMIQANLSGADLSGANLDGANIYDADLTGANLSGANLTYANIYNSDLTGANVSGVKADTGTRCPNGIHYRFAGNDCPW